MSHAVTRGKSIAKEAKLGIVRRVGKQGMMGLTPEQRRERDAKALQEKAARKASQAAAAGGGNMGGKSYKK